jgi:hypothetical protein
MSFPPNVWVSLASERRAGELMRRLREAGYAEAKGELFSQMTITRPAKTSCSCFDITKASLPAMACAALIKIGTIYSMSSQKQSTKFQQCLFSSVASMGHDNHAAHHGNESPNCKAPIHPSRDMRSYTNGIRD